MLRTPFQTDLLILLTLNRHCASPLSGMGTTMALLGAHILAGALMRHPEDYDEAFAEYESKMRPVVDNAQKLIPGMPWVISPKTEWGVWFLNTLVWLLLKTRVIKLLFMLKVKKKENFMVEEFGFETVNEQPDLDLANY
jgi:2-polyprenyl-6-methoxyphenol hydroxylase-like FAD-dependent oxidoreductase